MPKRIQLSDEELAGLVHRINTYLYAHGMNEAELSYQCWLSQDVVSRILRGTTAPSKTTIEHLARGMGITPAELIYPLPPQSAILPCAFESEPTDPGPWSDVHDDEPLHIDLDPDVLADDETPQETENIYPCDADSILVEVLHKPYLVVYKDTDFCTYGLNLSQISTWKDSRTDGLLRIRLVDGTELLMAKEERAIVLPHLVKLTQSTPETDDFGCTNG